MTFVHTSHGHVCTGFFQVQEYAVAALTSLLGAVTAHPETVSVTDPLPFSNDRRPVLPDQGTADADDAARKADSADAGHAGAVTPAAKPLAKSQSTPGARASKGLHMGADMTSRLS